VAAVSDAGVIIITGPPGAGKTTVARDVAAAFTPSIVLASDALWAWVVNGFVEPWELEAREQNRAIVRAVLAAAARLAEAGYATVLEGIVGPWFMELVHEELDHLTVPVGYVVLRPSLEVCLARAHQRRSDPQHAGALAEEGPIRHMYAQFASLGTYESHALDTSALNAEETTTKVLDGLRRREEFALGTL
jgi:adenylate kinase family enzyme